MSGITALGTTYNLPNYTGVLFALTPADTPFLSAIGGLSGGGQVTSTEFEWQTYDLRSADQPAVLEGQDAPTAQERVRGNVTNVVQIHQESISVSYTKQAAIGLKSGTNNDLNNPIADELDWQTAQMLKQMARDVDYSFLNGVYQKPSDNTTARKTRGMLAAVTTNVIDNSTKNNAQQTGTAAAATDLITLASHGLSIGDQIVFSNVGTATPLATNTTYYVAASGFTTGVFKVSLTNGGSAVDITADGTVVWYKLGALTKGNIDDLLQSVYDNGGITEMATATLVVNSAQRRAVTNAYLGSGAGNYVTKELAGNVGGVTVDRIDTDFGTLNIMLERQMPQNKLLLASMEQIRPVFLEVPGKGHFFAEPLAKTGAQDKVHLYGEVGLAYGNEKSHGVLTNLKV